jgi:hypothetical protein
MVDMDTRSESSDEDRAIGSLTARLAHELNQPQKQAEMRSTVESEFRRFDDARVRQFVPILVERQLRADLRRLARA